MSNSEDKRAAVSATEWRTQKAVIPDAALRAAGAGRQSVLRECGGVVQLGHSGEMPAPSAGLSRLSDASDPAHQLPSLQLQTLAARSPASEP